MITLHKCIQGGKKGNDLSKRIMPVGDHIRCTLAGNKFPSEICFPIAGGGRKAWGRSDSWATPEVCKGSSSSLSCVPSCREFNDAFSPPKMVQPGGCWLLSFL